MQSQLLTVEEALEQILSHVRPLPTETVALEEANGRVLREPALARVDLPPFPSSAMDGFAVRAGDLPGTLPVVEQIAAGRPARRPLASGAGSGAGVPSSTAVMSEPSSSNVTPSAGAGSVSVA